MMNRSIFREISIITTSLALINIIKAHFLLEIRRKWAFIGYDVTEKLVNFYIKKVKTLFVCYKI